MEIQEIKQRLTMAQVLSRYGLKPDKHMRMNCPFHEDKTPSMQVYYKTHSAYCFSSNCPTPVERSELTTLGGICNAVGINRQFIIAKT